MPLHLFKDLPSAQKTDQSGQVFVSQPMTVEIDDSSLQRMTLSQIATKLQKNVADKHGAIGITLISLQFALIANPETVKADQPVKVL
jgi:hypothetical protein